MSRSLNKVMLIGNVGSEPDIRATSSGTRVAKVSLATSRQWKDGSGQQKEKTEWHRLTFFGRLVDIGVPTTFFIYVFINIAMVTGLIPVVGVPLPLVSYGGTAMVTIMVGVGLLMSVYVHRDIEIPRRGPV